MTTPEQKKNKLPRGWTRLKTVGEIIACDILVDQKDGRFSVMPVFGEQGIASYHQTLLEAEKQIAAMQRDNMVEVLCVNEMYGDEFPHTYVAQMRFVNGRWYDTHGRGVDRKMQILVPTPDLIAVLKNLREEYSKARQRVAEIRKSAIDLAAMSLKMEPPQE